MSLTQAQINMLAAMGMPYQQPTQQAPQVQPQAPVAPQAPAQYVPPQPFQAQIANPTQPPASQNQLQTKIQAGPGIPAALVGRSLGEVIEAMTRTATRIQQLERGGAQPQQPTQPQTQAQQILNAGTPQQVPVQTPAGMTMEAIQQSIQQAIANATLPQNLTALEQSVAATVPAYNDPSIRAGVQEIIGQLPPEHQLNRSNWDQAIALVVGQRALSGQGIPSGFVQPTGNQPWQPQQAQQPQGAPQTFQPANVQTAFVEAPSGSIMNANRPPLTQQEAQIGRMLGLDPQALATHNQQAFA
jgi:hypothetical protein